MTAPHTAPEWAKMLNDSYFRALVQLWPALPESIKANILALARAVHSFAPTALTCTEKTG